MKIYRIYKLETQSEYDSYLDDYKEIQVDITIKYVDSYKKVENFMNMIETYNNNCSHCYNCPIIKLTKRKYNNQKDKIDTYCENKNLVFNGNTISCKNQKYLDFTQYFYEEIIVE